MTCAGGVCFRRNLNTISRLEYETKSVSEDIQVLQINLHRGSLSSIDANNVSELDQRFQPPAILENGGYGSNEK